MIVAESDNRVVRISWDEGNNPATPNEMWTQIMAVRMDADNGKADLKILRLCKHDALVLAQIILDYYTQQRREKRTKAELDKV